MAESLGVCSPLVGRVARGRNHVGFKLLAGVMARFFGSSLADLEREALAWAKPAD